MSDQEDDNIVIDIDDEEEGVFIFGVDYDLDDLAKQCEGTECIVKERDQDKRVIFIYLIITSYFRDKNLILLLMKKKDRKKRKINNFILSYFYIK